jgi:hypothetical protein
MKTPKLQEQVIDVLMRDSEEFNTFYLKNMAELDKLEISWYENSTLQNGLCRPHLDGTFLIELRQIPPLPTAAFIVAHELYHCLLWRGGYPRLKPVDKIGLQIVGDVQSAIYDHEIHRRLFIDFPNGCSDIKSIFQKFYDTHLDGKSVIEKELENRLLFVFINCCLSLTVLCDTTLTEQFPIINWVKTNRADIYQYGMELVSQIRECDFNSKSEVKDLIEEILSLVGLSSHIIVYQSPHKKT